MVNNNAYQRRTLPDGTIVRKGSLDSVAKFGLLTQGLNLKGKDVLDIGCNAGMMSILAAAAGARVVGIDSDPDVIQIAKDFRDREYPRAVVVFYPWTLADVPSTERYDVVIASSVLHHCGDFGTSIRKIRLLLRPGGVLTADIWPATYTSPYNKLEYSVPTVADAAAVLFSSFRSVAIVGDASAMGRPGARWLRCS